jgi:hypothetical protein
MRRGAPSKTKRRSCSKRPATSMRKGSMLKRGRLAAAPALSTVLSLVLLPHSALGAVWR